ncbi:MAG TPA: hypothetical protein VKB09_07205, partial [Thermomicrobiales bacterium]|nr:hypothetical protein [Thermomicrobiales bacterium]
MTTGGIQRRRQLPSGAFGSFGVLGVVSVLVYLFLYLPLIVIVLYSFNANRIATWPIDQYTLDWYRELRIDREIIDGIKLSVRVGALSALLAVVLGTSAALAIDRFEFPGKPAIRYLIVLP